MGIWRTCDRRFQLFASLATYWTGRHALRQRSLPRGFGWTSVVLAVFYWLGLANLVLFDAGVSFASEVGSLLVALGAVLALVWAAWLGWALGRVTSRPEILEPRMSGELGWAVSR